MIGRLADDADLRRRLKDELEVLAHVPLGEIAHLSGEGCPSSPTAVPGTAPLPTVTAAIRGLEARVARPLVSRAPGMAQDGSSVTVLSGPQ